MVSLGMSAKIDKGGSRCPLCAHYYNAIGKKPPRAESKALASDIRSAARLQKGDVFVGSAKKKLAHDVLSKEGLCQPSTDILYYFEKAVAKAISQNAAPRYLHEFIHSPYLHGDSLRALSPWLYFYSLVTERADNAITSDMRKRIEKLFGYFPKDKGFDAALQTYSVSMEQFLADNKSNWVDKQPSIATLNDIVIKLWRSVLGDDIYSFSAGHLRSAALFERMLVGRLREEVLLKRPSSSPTVVTRSLKHFEARYDYSYELNSDRDY